MRRALSSARGCQNAECAACVEFRLRELVVLLGSLSALGGVAACCGLLPDVSPTTVALALLLVVLGAATVGRLRVAIVVSMVAMLTLNFFFLPPVGTFTIADPQNWIALFAFLVVAVIASNLSAAAQDRAARPIARRNEVTRLFDLTRDVLLTTETAGAIDVLARHVARRFELPQVAICLPADHGWRIHQGGSEDVASIVDVLNTALAKARGTLEFDARQRAYGGHVRSAGEQASWSLVPLRHGTKAVGLLAAASPTARHRHARRRRGRRRDRDRTRAVPGRARRRGAGPAEGRPRGDAARVAEPRPAHAADGDPRRRREPARRPAGRGTSRAGRRGHRRAGSADAPVPGHPRHGAHRRRGDPRRPAVGHARRCRRRRHRARPARARRTRAARRRRRRSRGRRSIRD